MYYDTHSIVLINNYYQTTNLYTTIYFGLTVSESNFRNAININNIMILI